MVRIEIDFFFVFVFAEAKKVTIVTDSIAKYVSGIDGVVVQVFSGATIGRIVYGITNREVKLRAFDYVIFHVGTNDVGNQSSFENIISNFGNLVGACRKIHPSIHILISAILPRPIDHTYTDDFIRSVNGHLDKFMSKHLNFRFMKTYRPFMFGGKVRPELFAHRDGGLHLNIGDTEKLRYYFLRTIASM